MLLSLQWLREFTPYEGTAEDLGAVLTMLGLELDALIRPYREMEDTVVGLVRECARLPESDHLSLCKVDTGEPELLEIVCGAPNVAEGQYVVVAPVGASLPGGIKIKKAKLRGIASHGMICSERELGLSDDHEGILVLQEALPNRSFQPGQKAVLALGLDSEVLDIGVTPNRPDCLSILGLARETALAFHLPLTLPKLNCPAADSMESVDAAIKNLTLEMTGSEIAPFYALRLITDLTVRPSPAWMRWRLRSMGQRTISNLVDVTNYVMLELGQPLHSFDGDRICGGTVRVAPAVQGEKLVLLDGRECDLLPGDITIRDAEGPIGLGGVMGGADTAINSQSRTVLLEGAVFNPALIRRTSKRLNLPSEAAYRFERGVDQQMTAFALNRAALLIAELGGGRTGKDALGKVMKPFCPPRVLLRKSRASLVIGVPLTTEFCAQTLTRLGCSLREETSGHEGAHWIVLPPSWRPDLEREADLVEELARVYGVDKIPENIPRVTHTLEKADRPESLHAFLTRVKFWAAGVGLNETINYSFVGHNDLDFLGLPQDGRVSIKNPLNAEQDVLRPILAPGLCNALRHNLAQRAGTLRLFEVAACFSKDAASPYGTGVREERRLGILLYGGRYADAWPHQQEMTDYLDLKGLAEHFFLCLGLPVPDFVPDTETPFLTPAARMILNGELAGTLGRIKPELADTFYAKKDIWLAEILLDPIVALHSRTKPAFTPLPMYPLVRRDITIIAPADMEAGSILAAIRANRPEYLEDVLLWDLYQSQEKKQERRLTYRLVFRHPSRTLLDSEVDKIRDHVAKSLVETLAVRI